MSKRFLSFPPACAAGAIPSALPGSASAAQRTPGTMCSSSPLRARAEVASAASAVRRPESASLKDDAADIMAAVYNTEVIVFATPISYHEMCGQLKKRCSIRMNPLFRRLQIPGYLTIATAEEDRPTTFDKAYNGLLGWVDCFERRASRASSPAAG